MVREVLQCSTDEKKSSDEMEKLVFDFIADVLEQPVAAWSFESSLMHFLTIHVIDPKHPRLATPSTFVSALIALSYVAQLILLEKGLPQSSRSGKNFVFRWVAYHEAGETCCTRSAEARVSPKAVGVICHPN